ncbi:MAG TPA: hypothetical protein DHV22_16575 [Xanthomarina gelatinilytica]|uniref:Uncharacterized protein n=1 Tax=Xanthomarina gelatinilytica TaxID=1137281 RepID=A0A3D6BW44_9FLAO|nr:hypothetical protein [Xanthomarina gelatinilytica]
MNINEEILIVLLVKEPPIGTWCFGMEGSCFKVVDRGEWYLLASDVDKPSEKKRCLVKSFVSIIK